MSRTFKTDPTAVVALRLVRSGRVRHDHLEGRRCLCEMSDQEVLGIWRNKFGPLLTGCWPEWGQHKWVRKVRIADRKLPRSTRNRALVRGAVVEYNSTGEVDEDALSLLVVDDLRPDPWDWD